MLRDGAGETEPASLNRLLATRAEALAIAALAPASQRLVALDFDANRDVIINGGLNRFRYLHFATHAYVDHQYPQLSGLALTQVDQQGRAQAGYLRLNDIYQLGLNADLAVLSACRTGLGKPLLGEGLIGLTRGFMYAGVPRVMVSLWDVPDRETAQLMKLFYRNLLTRRLTPGAALRNAQMQMWQQAESSAPFFWAAFILQGDPE